MVSSGRQGADIGWSVFRETWGRRARQARGGMAFLGAGGGGSVGGIGAMGGVLRMGSAQGVGRVLGCLGPKPDMLSALVEQADVEVQKIAAEDARLAALPAGRPDETAIKSYPWTDDDDKLLQRVVSTAALDAPAGVAVWDTRTNAFNAGKTNVRTKNALRQRWNVLRSHGWSANPEETTSGATLQSVQWWSPEDDACLRKIVMENGETEWLATAKQFNAARHPGNCASDARTPAGVRERWFFMKAMDGSSRATVALSSGQAETKPPVASKSSAGAATGNHVGSNNFKQAGKAHHKLQREMAAINKDIAALRTVPESHTRPEQEQLVSKVAQLIQAVENVDRLWLAVQSDRLDAQVKLVRATCLELTATAKEVRVWIGAAFKPESRATIPDTTPDEVSAAKRPQKKRKQIRNANQHAQAGIARKVLLAWLADEYPCPAQKDRYTLIARSKEAKDEMVRLVNAALLEHGLLPAYRYSNLVNWFKNMSYKQTLVAQGRLPPSWARANSDTEERYLSRSSSTDPSTGRKSKWTSDDAYRYDPKRLRILAESLDETIAHAIGQDEFTSDHFDNSSNPGRAKKTQYQRCAEHAKSVLTNYIKAEQPQLRDPYCATARYAPSCLFFCARSTLEPTSLGSLTYITRCIFGQERRDL